MNRLTKLEIDGYKSIHHLDIEFKNTNIMIGGNGVGKSNLISFFEMLLHMNQHEFQNFVMEQSGADLLLYNGRKQTEKCDFRLFRENVQFYGCLKATNQDSLFIAKQQWIVDEGQNNNYEIGASSEIINNDIVTKFRALEDIGAYHFHDTSKSSPMKSLCDINDNIALASDGRNIAPILYRIKETDLNVYQYIVQMIRLVAPYFHDFIFRDNPLNPKRIRLEWKKKSCDIPFGVEQLSDGTLRFICLVTLLCQPDELRKDVICIDEPELGLHPYAITVFAELLKKYAIKRQVIVATQSVELLDAFNPDDIIVVDNNKGESVFRRLSNEDLNEWLDDYSIGELWKKNVIGGRP